MLDYYIDFLSNNLTEAYLKDYGVKMDSLVNIASIYKIVNKTLSHSEYVSIANNGKILAYLDKSIPSQDDPAEPIAENRYLAYDLSGKKYIIDGDGKIIAEVTDASFDSDSYLFTYDGKLYDANLNLVYDTNEITYTLILNAYTYKIYRETVDEGDVMNEEPTYQYYIFKNGKMTPISIENNATISSSPNSALFYYTYSEVANDTYKAYEVYCNANGEEIFKIETTDSNYSSVYCNVYGNSIVFQYNYFNSDGEYETTYRVSVAK